MGLIDFLDTGSTPVGSDVRNVSNVAAHIFLLTLSSANVVYLLFIEGLAKRALQKNFLQQLAFFGALMQIGSCVNSIHRYNINDEFNLLYAHSGSAFGFIANCFNFIALGSILFHGYDNRKMKWRIYSVSVIGLAICCMYYELTTFEESRFISFEIFINVPLNMFFLWYTSWALQKGTVKIDSTVISKEAAIRTFKVLAFILFLRFVFFIVFLKTEYTSLGYIMYGLNFCCVNIGTYYMDKMVDLYDKPVRREGESLLP